MWAGLDSVGSADVEHLQNRNSAHVTQFSSLWAPLLSQARDLGGVKWSRSDGVLELSVFKS